MAKLGWYIHAHWKRYENFKTTREDKNAPDFNSIRSQHNEVLNAKKNNLSRTESDDKNKYIELLSKGKKALAKIFEEDNEVKKKQRENIQKDMEEGMKKASTEFSVAGLDLNENLVAKESNLMKNKISQLSKDLQSDKEITDFNKLIEAIDKQMGDDDLLNSWYNKNKEKVKKNLQLQNNLNKLFSEKTGKLNIRNFKKALTAILKQEAFELSYFSFEYLIQLGGLLGVKKTEEITEQDIIDYLIKNMGSGKATGNVSSFNYNISSKLESALKFTTRKGNYTFGVQNLQLYSDLTKSTQIKADGYFEYNGQNIYASAKNYNSHNISEGIKIQENTPLARILMANSLTGDYLWSNHILNIYGSGPQEDIDKALMENARQSLERTAVFYAVLGYTKNAPSYILINKKDAGENEIPIKAIPISDLLNDYDDKNNNILNSAKLNVTFPSSIPSFFTETFYDQNSYVRAARILAMFKQHHFTVILNILEDN